MEGGVIKKQIEVKTIEWKDGAILQWTITIREDGCTEYVHTTDDSVVVEVLLAVCRGYPFVETVEPRKWDNVRTRTWRIE